MLLCQHSMVFLDQCLINKRKVVSLVFFERSKVVSLNKRKRWPKRKYTSQQRNTTSQTKSNVWHSHNV